MKDETLSEEELKCLRLLYSSNYLQHKARNPSRVAGTCEWFLAHPKYVDWYSSQTSSLLWVSADAGCGKSVLSSWLVDLLRNDEALENSTICCFFFKDDNEQQRYLRYALPAILHQVLADDIKLLRHVVKEFRLRGDKFAIEFETLWNILGEMSQDKANGRPIVCVIDGLDECEEADRKIFIETLDKWYSEQKKRTSGTEHPLKFLITSRPNILVIDQFFDHPTIRLKAEDETKAISQDIQLVVASRMAAIGRRRKLPEDEQKSMAEYIVTNADRTFLWVELVLQSIEKSERFSKKSLKALLEHLPPGLDGIYTKILSESPASQHTRKLLNIVVAAFRPLSVKELNVAFCLDLTDRKEEDVDLEPDIESTVKSLCGIFLRITDSTIYLAHQTAKEFLLASDPSITSSVSANDTVSPWKHSFHPQQAHRLLAERCKWYLLFSVFENHPLTVDPNVGDAFKKSKVEEYTCKYSLLDYAARYWGDHFRLSKYVSDDEGLASFLTLYDTSSHRFRTWWTSFWTLQINNSSFAPEKVNALMIASYLGHEEVIKKLVADRSNPIRRLFRNWYQTIDDINDKDEDGESALSWATRRGNVNVVRLFLEQHNVDINCQNSLRWTPLTLACRFGHLDIVQMLLGRKDVLTDPGDDRRQTPLSWAAAGGYVEIMRLLLKRKDVNINSRSIYNDTPLSRACSSGSPEAVRFLLSFPELRLDFADAKSTPLPAAAGSGNSEIFHAVLERGQKERADLNLEQSLFKAAERGHTAIVRCVLELRPDLLNAREESNAWTPLALAARGGHFEVAKLLLEYPQIEINAVDKCRAIPLTWSVGSGFRPSEVADLLLERPDTQADHVDNNGQTPFMIAAQNGNLPVLNKLIARSDVNFNARCNRGWSALVWAAERGQSLAIQRLLEIPSLDVNLPGNEGMTALSWAVWMGFIDIVRLLLSCPRVSLVVKDGEGRMVFHIAAQRQQYEILKLLFKAFASRKGVEPEKLFPNMSPAQLAALGLESTTASDQIAGRSA
ncbi:MAG: hypothetical protein M1822_004234 [Bathelium mastoideum]|nr:MAG: hypothetical protein M1822_004234 [Bathelium mastoideum]